MIFITDADITDDVLVVDQSDIDAANAYVGSTFTSKSAKRTTQN